MFSKYSILEYIIMDQDSTFMSTLISLKKFGNKIKIVAHKHQCLQAEHCFKSLATILMKHLAGLE